MGKHRRATPQMPQKAAARAYLIRKYGQHACDSGGFVKLAWRDAIVEHMVKSFWDQYTKGQDTLVHLDHDG